MSTRKGTSFEITVFSKAGGVLTKRIGLSKDGALIRDGSECRMTGGWAYRTPIADLHALAAKIANAKTGQRKDDRLGGTGRQHVLAIRFLEKSQDRRP